MPLAPINFTDYVDLGQRKNLFKLLDSFFRVECRETASLGQKFELKRQLIGNDNSSIGPELKTTGDHNIGTSSIVIRYPNSDLAISFVSDPNFPQIAGNELPDFFDAAIASPDSKLTRTLINRTDLEQIAGDKFLPLMKAIASHIIKAAKSYVGSLSPLELFITSNSRLIEIPDLLPNLIDVLINDPQSQIAIGLAQRPDLRKIINDDRKLGLFARLIIVRSKDFNLNEFLLANPAFTDVIGDPGLTEILDKVIGRPASQSPTSETSITAEPAATKSRWTSLSSLLSHSRTAKQEIKVQELIDDSIKPNPDSKLARGLARNPNLKNIAGNGLDDIINLALKEPDSRLAFGLARNPNLKDIRPVAKVSI